MGFVFQEYELLSEITALDNVILSGLLDKRNKEELVKRAHELSEYLEIDRQLLGKYPQELSGGEKQKIAIARALCNDPPFLSANSSVQSPEIFLPSMNSSPSVGDIRSPIILRSVVFPHPDFPINDTYSPCPITTSIPFNTSTERFSAPADTYVFLIPFNSICTKIIS